MNPESPSYKLLRITDFFQRPEINSFIYNLLEEIKVSSISLGKQPFITFFKNLPWKLKIGTRLPLSL